ncbi:class I SAM-dependent methyltransferase [Patescibacteria group bacterium]|nr:class I SAM-dependent methyltransferase [Patescibacteria group bacterium]
MNYIIRDKSLLTGEKNLEHLYTLKNFPVFMGCVDTPADEDIKADMVWDICSDTGLIQLRKLIPLDILYLDQHNDGVGKVWQDHYRAFAKFLYKNNPGKNILEIGGAHDIIANNCLELDDKIKWTIVEPNPQYIKNKQIKVIQGWFDDKFSIHESVDTIVHSHVFEHTYEPFKFIEHIAKFLKLGQKHIFTFPNMEEMLKNNFTNCLNFEHTVFLTEAVTEYILEKCGFKILSKEYYGSPHSIFYATEKIALPSNPLVLENKYNEYKKLFMDFVNYHLNMVADLNKKIDSAKEPVYMFGAHIFSQYLIGFGLNTKKIVKILDNSAIKNGKRLYGTSLMVDSPKILAGQGKVNVILKAGIYNEEIKKDILENINNKISFW